MNIDALATRIMTTMANYRSLISIATGLIVFAFIVYFRLGHAKPFAIPQLEFGGPGHKRFDGRWNFKRDAENLMLDSHQCEQAFPGLFHEVERPGNDRKDSPITLEELDSVPQQNGYVRAMIYDQQVRVKL